MDMNCRFYREIAAFFGKYIFNIHLFVLNVHFFIFNVHLYEDFDYEVLFSRSKTGALLVFERETMLSDIAATGTIIDAETSVALFGNIFFNKAPLHDGASIIRDGKLFAAGCILPLTSNPNVDINLGTRHRAGLGISEQSDAVVLIVSEETGVISLAVNGILLREFTREELIKKLEQFLIYDRGYDDDEPPKKFFQKNPKSSKREKAEK